MAGTPPREMRCSADASRWSLSDDPRMTIGDDITTLDAVAASLRAMASGDVAFDRRALSELADHVAAAADRAQQVADLQAVVALLEARLATASEHSSS